METLATSANFATSNPLCNGLKGGWSAISGYKWETSYLQSESVFNFLPGWWDLSFTNPIRRCCKGGLWALELFRIKHQELFESSMHCRLSSGSLATCPSFLCSTLEGVLDPWSTFSTSQVYSRMGNDNRCELRSTGKTNSSLPDLWNSEACGL